jgi:hypothetical protein
MTNGLPPTHHAAFTRRTSAWHGQIMAPACLDGGVNGLSGDHVARRLIRGARS